MISINLENMFALLDRVLYSLRHDIINVKQSCFSYVFSIGYSDNLINCSSWQDISILLRNIINDTGTLYNLILQVILFNPKCEELYDTLIECEKAGILSPEYLRYIWDRIETLCARDYEHSKNYYDKSIKLVDDAVSNRLITPKQVYKIVLTYSPDGYIGVQDVKSYLYDSVQQGSLTKQDIDNILVNIAVDSSNPSKTYSMFYDSIIHDTEMDNTVLSKIYNIIEFLNKNESQHNSEIKINNKEADLTNKSNNGTNYYQSFGTDAMSALLNSASMKPAQYKVGGDIR